MGIRQRSVDWGHLLLRLGCLGLGGERERENENTTRIRTRTQRWGGRKGPISSKATAVGRRRATRTLAT